MTKRKGKGNNKQDDSLLLLETPSVTPQRGFKEYALPAIVIFIFAVGGLTALWFSSQQQQTIDSLTETVNAMQVRITKFQQQLGMGNAQIANVGVFEERLQALEEAYTQAQKKADVALATSEKIKSTDLQSQVWSLQSEMNGKLSELQQEFVSTASLNAVVKNKTEEIETLKQRLNSIFTANSEVAVTISGLTDAVLVTKSRLDEQMSTVQGLTSELEEQRMELTSLKQYFAKNKKALERNRQEVIDIKDLLEMEQTKRSQALEEQLMAVRRSLEDHQKSTRSLHSHLASQLEVVQSQMLSESQQSGSEEDIPVENQQVEQAETQEEVPIKDQKDQPITEEETVAEEVRVEEEEQVIPEEEEPAEEVHFHREEPAEEQVVDNETPEEAEVKKDVSEEQVTEEDEQVVTEEDEQADEVPLRKEEAEEEAVTQQDEIHEELQVSDEIEPAEEVQVLGEEEAIEKHAIPEEVQVKDGDVFEEQALTDVDEITEEIPIEEEETVMEQTESILPEEDLTSTEEMEIDMSMAEAVENFSQDHVEDISQEETPQEPLDETVKQKNLEEVEEDVQDSEEEEPVEDIVEELDEKDISANES
ncbi:probable serine/threonine-protein kinase kinX [Chanodichthys erythropterus]|uniref:probable serine/threonine-protein kinase kinX n=1 Tax=Chanodichthys erythropterus TaxID=933992 RepID=UPI00351E19C7